MQRPRVALLSTLVLFSLSPLATFADDILQQIPRDALGVVVVKQVAAADAKIDQLLGSLSLELPKPSQFLSVVTGITQGIDENGDVLIAVLPSADGAVPTFAIWLPIEDYNRMLASYPHDVTTRDGIAEVRVADEVLLLARHGNWALIMDRDERDRMAKMLAGDAEPPAVVLAWKDWIDKNAATVVVFRDGIGAAIKWTGAADDPAADAQGSDQLEPTAAGQPAAAADPAVDRFYAPLRTSLRSSLAISPKLVEWLESAEALGCAFRLDQQQNAQASVRVHHPHSQLTVDHAVDDAKLPPGLYQGGEFILYGAGRMPSNFAPFIADVFTRSAAQDLRKEQRLKFDESKLARFKQAVETAASAVDSFMVLTHPGGKSAGLYTNSYWLVGVDSSDEFVDDAGEVMRLWNTLNREAKEGNPLLFDVEEKSVGGRDVTEYSLDIAEAEEELALPEVRQVMERFFGPGGKLRLWIVPVDDRTVMLAAATQDEVAAALQVLDAKKPTQWDEPPVAAVNDLLPADADWRLFISPSDYHAWKVRLLKVQVGATIGGVRKPPFPSSPPVGLAANFEQDGVAVELVVTAETIQSFGKFRSQ